MYTTPFFLFWWKFSSSKFQYNGLDEHELRKLQTLRFYPNSLKKNLIHCLVSSLFYFTVEQLPAS